MKNKFLITIFLILLNTELFSEELSIEAKNVTLDKTNELTIFKDDVLVRTKDKVITSNFASYDKKSGDLILKINVVAKDSLNNTIETEYAEYNKISKILETTGKTVITTTDNYILQGDDIFADGEKKNN